MYSLTTPTISNNIASDTAKLPKSLQYIVDACRRTSHFTPATAARLLANAKVQPDELLPWADFDHPVVDGYGRKTVSVGGHYELMIMSWNPGDFSAIHDHGRTQWGAVQSFGETEHGVYEIDGPILRTTSRTVNRDRQINQVNHDLIHQMGNSTNRRAMSLHLYGCVQPGQGITDDARIFDLLNAQIQTTDGGVFYVLPEWKVNERLGGFVGDRETTREHHRQMLDRIARIQASGETHDQDLNLIATRLQHQLYCLDSRSEWAA